MSTLWLLLLFVIAACIIVYTHKRRSKETQRKKVQLHCPDVDLQRENKYLPSGEEKRQGLDDEPQKKTGEQRSTDEESEAADYQECCETFETQPEAVQYPRLEEEVMHVAEEVPSKVDEGGDPIKEKKDRKDGDVRQEIKTDTKRLQPSKRGGRPRGSSKERKSQPAQETTSRCPKPEIVCWKRERHWIPSVEVPEELLASPNLAVLQNGLPLTQDESREGCWCLKEVCGQVVVQWNEDEVAPEINKIPLGEESYLLFKLSGQDQNQGRRVKSPSSGWYLVMVPDNWERDDTLSGPPPVKPERTSIPGYLAHFFELEKDGSGTIVFRKPTGEPFEIKSKAPQFELVGNRLYDATENIGPLFGGRPPHLRALKEHGWKNVGTIVVGEEGMGKERWRTRFTRDSDGQKLDMPSEVADRKGGWYFLRLYDTKDDLIESLDFRFLNGLKEIRLHQPSPLPSENGHRPVLVEFFHEPHCAAQPTDGLTNIQIERQDDKTILTIPADPTYDETQWLVGAEGGPQIEVTILVERLWWGVGEEQNAPSEWKDQPLAFPRDDFSAASMKAIWLRLPKRRWVDKVLVGFEQPKARPYDLRVTERTIAVPLREFGDFKEESDCAQEHRLKVWIKRDNTCYEGIVAIIPIEKRNRIDNERLKNQVLLNIDGVPSPRLATALTYLRRETRGPLRVLVKEVRRMYLGKRKMRRTEPIKFNKFGLCIIALVMELTSEIPGLKKRYGVKAQLAKNEFPEIMNHLRNRYKEISSGRAYQARSNHDKMELA